MENDEKLRKEMQKLEERMFNVNGLLPKSCAES
jgi:hypothetical protein